MPDVSQIDSYARLLRLVPAGDVTPAPLDYHQPFTTSLVKKRSIWPKSIVSFCALVLLPSMLVCGYFWLLAAPRYESEARFVLRVPGRAMVGPEMGQMASLLQGTGVNRSSDDGYIIQEFLESRDAMVYLEAHADLRRSFALAENDPFWRYPGFFASATEEGLYKLYKRLISVTFDNSSGVSTLKVQAFSPADARRESEALLAAAESLVNRLNERSRQDATALADAEADRARQRVLATQRGITTFRERERMVDPAQVTIAVLEALAKLGLETAQLSVQIGELLQVSPSSPQLAPLRNRRAALEAQIAIERQRLGGDAQSIAPRIAEYEGLMLEREFADKALIAAMSGVEMARVEATRKQVYLERVARPGEPDYAAYPWRILWSLFAAGAGYLAWRIWRIVAADARRHLEL